MIYHHSGNLAKLGRQGVKVPFLNEIFYNGQLLAINIYTPQSGFKNFTISF